MASGIDDQPVRRAVISGIGQSDIGRRLFRPALALTLDAAVAAVADAGLTMGDIDGLATYPGGLAEVHDALRLQPSWYGSGAEGAAQLGPVIHAAMAVGCGLARHVLVYRTVTEGSDRAIARAAAEEPVAESVPSPPRVEGPMRWLSVYGVTGAPQWYAFYVRRYMHDFGLTHDQLARSHAARTKAALNPRAVYRDPMTVDDYLASRMISDPICLFDCDVPCDGSTAFVVSARRPRRGRPPRNRAHRLGRRRRPPHVPRPVARRVVRGGPPSRCGPVPPSGPATSTWPSSTTASASSPCRGSSRSASASAAKPAAFWRVALASASTVTYRSTLTADSWLPDACTAWASSTKHVCSCATKPVPAKSPTPKSPW